MTSLRYGLCVLLAINSPLSAEGQDGVEVRGAVLIEGQPAAARLYIRSAEGKWFHAEAADKKGPEAVPYHKQRADHIVEIHTAVPAGDFTTKLPPGRYLFSAERGKEFFSSDVPVTVKAAGNPRIEIPLKRWIDMAAEGWYSGDTHVHRGVDEIRVPLLAEDLNVAFPLTYWVTEAHKSPTASAKSVKENPGNKPIIIAPQHVIYPLNTEYELFTYGGKRHTLGAVFIINHKQPIELGAPPVARIAAEARRQGALLDLDKHTWPWSAMIVPVMKVDLFELANNHMWRTNFLFRDWTIETLPDDWEIETDAEGGWTERGWIDFGFKTYYAFLNCGFDMKPTGGTATGVHPVPLGFGRVYVEVDGEFSFEKWFAGLKAGRSFVTTGPMLTVKFNGQPAGTRFRREMPGETQCTVTGTAASAAPLGQIEIIVNGEVAETIRPANARQANGSYRSNIDAKVTFPGSGWVAVRCFQPRDSGRFFFAHTGPVHFDVSSAPLKPKRKEVWYFLKRVNEEIERNRGVLTAEELGEFETARGIYAELLERSE